MAPVVVNLKSRIARQVALENSGYTVAMPVPLIAESPADTSGQAGAVPE
jgi:flagellar assembly factor FliW